MVPTSAILAVALGLAPVGHGGAQQVRVAPAAVAQAVAGYAETVDRRGAAHLTGLDRRTGQRFDIRIDPAGHVEAVVGAWLYTFRVSNGA